MLHLIHIFQENTFLLRAICSCIFIAFICPVLGIFLMLRRMSLIGDALSHAILPGVAIAFMFYGMSVIAMAIGGLIAGITISLFATVVSRYNEIKEDASFASFYLISLALGVAIISFSGTNVDLIHILFGSLLSIDNNNLILLAMITSISIIIMMIIIRPIVIDIFDMNLLKIYGVSASIYQALFLFLIVLNLVIDFQIMGTLLVVGLMVLPASTAKILAKSINYMIIIAILSAIISSIIGMICSYYFNIATGPMIILINGIIY